MSLYAAGLLYLGLLPIGLIALVATPKVHWIWVIVFLVCAGAAQMALRCPRCRTSIFSRPDKAGFRKILSPPATTCATCGLDLRATRLGEGRRPEG